MFLSKQQTRTMKQCAAGPRVVNLYSVAQRDVKAEMPILRRWYPQAVDLRANDNI
jgi:hypothetical protein